MKLYFIRHAQAGTRGFGVDDRYRLLDDRGLERSTEIADFLADERITVVVSSPATRCVQTVQPLADRLGLSVIEDEALWEDAYRDDALQTLERYAAAGAAICSHGNIIPEVLELLGDQGCEFKGRGCEKGSIWELTWNGNKFTKARYRSRKQSRP